MSVTTVRLQAEVEQHLEAIEVHSWLNSWGTENEQDAPRSGK